MNVKPFRIAADENIPYVREVFSPLGEVTLFQGRRLTSAQLKNTDILLVRSVSRVNRELLENSPVRFVGSATIGFDHIDLPYLAERGIGFATAPGSNAVSAAEYVLSALLVIAERRGFKLRDKSVGIIGCGNVGSRLKSRLEALGVPCLINDPPKQAQGGSDSYVDLHEALRADIVSVHVPLERGGAYPTYKLADADFFERLAPDAVFVNTSRGDVVDETALLQKLKTCPAFNAVLDVWKNEPRIDFSLMRRTALATPHIAGYSFDGKVRGTQMLFDAVRGHFNLTHKLTLTLPQPALTHMAFSTEAVIDEVVCTAVQACYDPRRDDAALRRILQADDPGAYFDTLRRHYPIRREFSQMTVKLPAQRTELADVFRGLGFGVDC